MLGDSHGVEDGGIRSPGVCPCGVLNEFRSDAGDPGDILRGVPCHGLPQLIKVVHVLFDEFRRMEILADDHMHQSVEEGYVGTAFLPDVNIGIFRHFDFPGIADDEGALALPLLLLDEGTDDGVVFSGVRADDENGVGRLDGFEVIGHCAASEGLAETRNCGAVSQMGTVVDVVGAHHLPCEALHEIVLLVGAPGGREEAESVSAVLLLYAAELFRHQGEGFVPGGLPEGVSLTDKGCRKPVFAVDELPGKPSLDAGSSFVQGRGAGVVRRDVGYFAGFPVDVDFHFAAYSAIGADGLDLFNVPGAAHAESSLLGEGADRTDLNALAAEHTVGQFYGRSDRGLD